MGKEQLQNFRGLVKKIIIGQVTRAYYTASTEVWPDEEYPHRFDFKIIQDYGEDIYFGTEFFNDAFVEAVRYSACTQGSVTQADTITLLADISRDVDEQADETPPAVVSGYEGKPIMRLHQSRERDPKIIKQKKEQVLKETGKLKCEICSMDFEETYGILGHGFAECHHKSPLALRDKNEETDLCDLAIVCPNCHRMLHRKRPWLTLDDLKAIYENQKS